MKITHMAAGALFSLALITPLSADDAVDHFEARPSDTLEQAIANFTRYNARLATVLEGELDAQAMTEIHKLTYTLEVALEKIEDELDELAETLEEVHIASERFDAEGLKQHGDRYITVTELLKALGGHTDH